MVRPVFMGASAPSFAPAGADPVPPMLAFHYKHDVVLQAAGGPSSRKRCSFHRCSLDGVSISKREKCTPGR